MLKVGEVYILEVSVIIHFKNLTSGLLSKTLPVFPVGAKSGKNLWEMK